MSADESVFAKINREADEKRMARKAECADADNIWNTHAPWMECGSDSSGLRPTEDTVFANHSRLHRWRYLAMRALEGDKLEAFVADVIGKIKQESDLAQDGVGEPIYNPNHKLPLRDVMAKRGEGLEWIDMGPDMLGKKHVHVTVVKIGISARKRR